MAIDPMQESAFRQAIEESLASRVGLHKLRAGWQIIRDSRGWRQDERLIEYVWIVFFDWFSVGCGGLVTIKFNENVFRGNEHSEELLQGVFSVGVDNQIQEFYHKTIDGHVDPVMDYFQLDIFNANKGITLDGVSYAIHVISPNIDTVMIVNNPNTRHWRKWETEIWKLGNALAANSGKKELVNLFSGVRKG